MKKGFSLVEVIVSIAALAIISGFVLEMFLVASRLNSKAKNLDFATNIAINSIELFKACDSVTEYKEDEFFKNSEINTIDGKVAVKKYYNENWMESNSSNAKFCLNVDFEQDEIRSSFYSIKSCVMDLENADDKELIVSFNTGKYIAVGEP